MPVIGCRCATCSSPDPRDKRNRCSVLVRASSSPDDAHILIDCPPEFRLQAIRERIARIDAVFLTHSHADHIFGLDDLRRYNHTQGEEIPVSGNTATLSDIRRIFNYVFVETQLGGGKPQFRLDSVDAFIGITVGSLIVYPLPVQHGSMSIYGYRIIRADLGESESDNRCKCGCDALRNTVGGIGYVTDCSLMPEETQTSLMNLDILVLGALRHRPHPTHYTLAQAVEISRKLKAKSTFFTHIAHDLMHTGTNNSLPKGMNLAYDSLTVSV